MSFPLLATKFYIPPARTDGVSRPRLIEKLQAGLDHPGTLILLSGPAGFGKTTLLSEFVAQLRRPVAWLSLDEGDNDPARFWTYLITACQSALAGVGESALALFLAPQPMPEEVVPTILINDMARVGQDLVVVLDDYHVIQNPSIQAAFSFLLDHLPGNLHILVSTRADPPWPLARLRARNKLVEVRARDLRFTTGEAAIFLSRVTGLNLPGEAIAALERRTEGWIAGLQLAALSMKGRSDIAGFIEAFTGSHVYVAEYLVEEVLQGLPEEMQIFLLHTSILERLNPELCDAVIGDSQQAKVDSLSDFVHRPSSVVLESLARSNLFIMPLDDEARWFRYHHLFTDLLRARLKQNVPEEAITRLHKRAADWYEQHGFPAEAVIHFLAAQDFENAARLVEEHAGPLLMRGELVTLLKWTEVLPLEVIWLHPPIIIAKIWALTLAGAVRQVEPLLQQAEMQLEIAGDTSTARELAGFAAAIRAFFAMTAGEDRRALELAGRAEALLPERSVHARWLLPYTIGAAYRGQGQYEKAVEAFERQARMGEEHDNLIVWGTGVTGVALVRHAQGRLGEVIETCRLALQTLAERGAARFGSLAKVEVPLVEALIEQNELEEAQQRLTGIISRMQNWPMPTDRIHAYLALIQLQTAQGDLPGAMKTLHTAKDLKATHPVLMNLARSVDLSEARLLLESGDIAAARRALDALQPGTSRWIELRDQEQLLLARLFIVQGKPEEAESILAPLANHPEASERKGTLITIFVLQSCVLSTQGDREAALAVLTRALELAEPEGFVRVFVDEGERIQPLFVEIAHQLETTLSQASLPSKAYVAKLLAAFPARPEPELTPPIKDEVTGLVEQLTSREREVLQLIAAGHSNRAISEELFITVSAVKKHTTNIFGKLNVNSRTQAVARARQLGLLSKNQ